MISDALIDWLLKSDVSIQYQVHRDLLSKERDDLKERISCEGWGAQILALQNEDGHWGRAFYQPKWTSTHYTLLDLRNLNIPPDNNQIRSCISSLLQRNKGPDGGINPHREIQHSDVCVNGMFLNYACYFRAVKSDLRTIVDFIIEQRMADGGFNCRSNRSGARHSSLHSTLCVAEGIREYQLNNYKYRLPELLDAESTSRDFILQHQLYLSDRTGEIIHKDFLKLAYPGRWRYDILRALDYFRLAKVPFDVRMEPALEQLVAKRKKQGYWTSSRHPGQTHIDMEKAGSASRWNTVRTLRVLQYFGRL